MSAATFRNALPLSLAAILASCLSGSISGCSKSKDSAQSANPASPSDDNRTSSVLFTPADLSGPPETHKSTWAKFSRTVNIVPENGGLRCIVRVGSEEAGYGGVKFVASPLRALRLDLALISPENIRVLYVDGYNSANQSIVRWRWTVAGKAPANGHDTYVLVPDQPSGKFVPVQATDMADLKRIDIFIVANQNTEAGFVLYKAEIGTERL